MRKIGILSDTHGHLDDQFFEFFKNCDEIWHTGDIGNVAIAERLEDFKPLIAVYGNIDGQDIRVTYPKHQRFFCEKVDVWMTHIGGYPGNYDRNVIPEIFNNPPRLFICGHSHILKVINDKKLNLLHINPGASGKYGSHHVRTLVRLQIDGVHLKELEILEMKR